MLMAAIPAATTWAKAHWKLDTSESEVWMLDPTTIGTKLPG